MAVPVEVVGDDVLNGAGEDVAVVRESGGEQRTVIENVLRRVLGPFELSLEGLDLRPEAKDFLLMFKEGEVFAFTYFFHCGRGAMWEESGFWSFNAKTIVVDVAWAFFFFINFFFQIFLIFF